MSKFQLIRLVIWFIIWLSVLGVGIILDGKSTPKKQKEYYSMIGQPAVSYNALLPISSPVFPEYKVYGTLVSEVVECESGGIHEGIWGKAGEYGIAQFMPNTFEWMAKLSGLQNPDWFNEEQQLWLLNWAIIEGYQNHWTCWKIIINNK